MAATPKDKTSYEMFSKKQQAILDATLPPEMLKTIKAQYVPAKQPRPIEGNTGNMSYDMAAKNGYNNLSGADLNSRIKELASKSNRSRDDELELNSLKGVLQYRAGQGSKLAGSDSQAQQLRQQMLELQKQQSGLINVGAGFNLDNSLKYYKGQEELAKLKQQDAERKSSTKAMSEKAKADYQKFTNENGNLGSVQAYAASRGFTPPTGSTPFGGAPQTMADGSLQYPGQQDEYVRARNKNLEMYQNMQNLDAQYQNQAKFYEPNIALQQKQLDEYKAKGGLITPEQYARYKAQNDPLEAQLAALQEQYQSRVAELGANVPGSAGYGSQSFLDQQSGQGPPPSNVAQPGPTFKPFDFNTVLKNYMAGNTNQPVPQGQPVPQQGLPARRPLFGGQNPGVAPFGSPVANNANRINFITTPPPNNQGTP